MLRFNVPRVVSIAVLTLVIVAGSGLPLISGVRADESKPPSVKELLRERLALLREIAAQSTKSYESGTVSFEAVHHANQAVLQAELDLCETTMQKIPLLEKAVAMAKQMEAVTIALVKGGEAPAVVATKAKVARLDAEIALARAKEG